MTNAERIRSMTDDELAEWLTNMCDIERNEEPYKSIYNLNTRHEEVIHDSYGDLLKWLQSEGRIGENMNERYLFKAKRIDNGEWVQGYLYGICEKRYVLCGMTNDIPDMIEVDPSTICQCTGLKDINGNLIWENDVVAYFDTYSTENGYAEAYCVGKVIWDNETLSFQVTERLSAESYEVLDECSVIGNVFDNPELLESEE